MRGQHGDSGDGDHSARQLDREHCRVGSQALVEHGRSDDYPGDGFHSVDDRQAGGELASLIGALGQQQPGQAERDQRPRLPVAQDARRAGA